MWIRGSYNVWKSLVCTRLFLSETILDVNISKDGTLT
jgi:hypothetical protein